MNKLYPIKCTFFVLLCALVIQTASAQSESELLQQLRADYYSLLDAMEEYEMAGEDYNMNASEQEDYAAWIKQLREQFTETCHTLSKQPNLEVAADIPCAEYASAYVVPVDIDIGQEYTDGEKTASIADEFHDSLGDFDEKLLREQDRVKANRPQTASAQSSGGGGAGESEGGSGGSSDSNSTGGEKERRQSDQQGSNAEEGTDQTHTGARGQPQRGNQANIPDDIPDGSDDDVVARQLREAAEMEKDPELREKLWDEYRRYKNGQ